MRKVVSYLIYSLDGVIEDPQEWVFDRFDKDMLGHLQATIDTQDSVLLGRVTYQQWAEHWPSSTQEPFASFINATPKYVVSTTLNEADWPNSTVLQGKLSAEVQALKELPGADIGVHGSARLVQSLLRDGLLDVLRLAVFPVVAGHGRRLFEDFHVTRRMELAEVEPTASGVLFITYRPLDEGE